MAQSPGARLTSLSRSKKLNPTKEVTREDIKAKIKVAAGELRKIRGAESLEAFMKLYGHHHFDKAFGPAQRELIQTLQALTNTGARIARAEPREFGKTTIVSWAILWFICYELKKFIIYVCDSRDQASLVIQTIQMELEENELIANDFGELAGKDRWGKYELLTTTNTRILARGAKSRMRGLKSFQYRPDLVIMDDVENDKNTETSILRDQLWAWVRKVVLNLPSANGDVIAVGTILHWDSVMTRILKDDAWNSKIVRALDKDGNSNWPEGWPKARLEAKQREIGGEAFSQEFMNEPIDSESQAFKRSFVQTYNSKEFFAQNPNQIFHHFLTWDPAWSSGKKAHFTAMMVIAVDGENNWYVRDMYRQHCSELEAINAFFGLADRYGVMKAGMETVFRQMSLKDAVDEEMRRRNKYFEVEKLKAQGKGDKQKRIRLLVPRWEMGSIYLPEDHPLFKALVDEFVTFPKGRTDDMIDAMAYMIQLASPPPRASDLRFMDNEIIVTHVDEETGTERSIGLQPHELYALQAGTRDMWRD